MPSSEARVRVGIVEDDLEMRELLREALGSQGYAVTAVGSGSAGPRTGPRPVEQNPNGRARHTRPRVFASILKLTGLGQGEQLRGREGRQGPQENP